jgi:hypothetical protein
LQARSCPRFRRPRTSAATISGKRGKAREPLRLRHPRAERERERTAETRGSMPERRGRQPVMRNRRLFCAAIASQLFLRHGSYGLRYAANAAASP